MVKTPPAVIEAPVLETGEGASVEFREVRPFMRKSLEEWRVYIEQIAQERVETFVDVLGSRIAQRASARMIILPVHDPHRDHWYLIVSVQKRLPQAMGYQRSATCIRLLSGRELINFGGIRLR